MKYLIPFFLLFIACQDENTNQSQIAQVLPVVQKTENMTFDPTYWYQGKAEVNAYDLEQSRYGEIHKGDAVLVFVTEDFLTDKQVKNDTYKNKNSISVLKTNALKKFTTGIYDYSIMSSVFTPVEQEKYPNTLKVTTTSQDWCGHTFMQLNHQKKGYKIQLNSYFESEGDKNTTISNVLLEDELFNRIRLNPDAIPTGEMQVLPSTTVLRLMHIDAKPQNAVLSKSAYLQKDKVGQDLQQLNIEYPDLKRNLQIIYEGIAPYKIIAWEDTYPSFSGKQLTSKATLRKTLITDYWSKHSLNDASLRKELGL